MTKISRLDFNKTADCTPVGAAAANSSLGYAATRSPEINLPKTKYEKEAV
jgi:hypothetical protein